MSIWKVSVQTNRRLWAASSGVMFVLVGFFGLMPIKGENGFASYWELWWMFLSRLPDGHPEAMVWFAIIGGVLAVPAVALGWVVQAVIVLAGSWLRPATSQHVDLRVLSV